MKKRYIVLICIGLFILGTLFGVFWFEPLVDYVDDVIHGNELRTINAFKPVLYLYPDEKTDVDVKLTFPNGEMTVSYPEYQDGWHVTAMPDGILYDESGEQYNYLYWESDNQMDWDFSEGWCVAGKDTGQFLEDKLYQFGLNRKEANEFIVYWLPKMTGNKYNLISFVGEEYTNSAVLDINPKPDNVIRVFMVFKPCDSYVDLPEQHPVSSVRQGFTVVEWGGCMIDGV